MNLPNKLSIMRVACVPIFVLLLYCSSPWCRWAAIAVFVIASLTDFLDGYLARKHQLVTDFGKFIDPLADKLLVLSAFIMLTELRQLPAWFTILILTRELSVDGLRLAAMTKKHVIAAGKLGKIKTCSQMFFILLLLCLNINAFSSWFSSICSVWVAIITLWSGVDYFIRNRFVFMN